MKHQLILVYIPIFLLSLVSSQNTEALTKITEEENKVLKEICGENRKVSRGYAAVRIFKIYNGKKAKPGQWPWAAAIDLPQYAESAECAGSLISRRHVLTAAHCLVDIDQETCGVPMKRELYQIHIGTVKFRPERNVELSLKNSGMTKREDVFYAKRFVWHKLFKCTMGHDIGIIELDRDVPAKLINSGKANVVCLPERYEKAHVQMYSHGWGLTITKHGKAVMPKHLHWTELVVMPIYKCLKNYEKSDLKKYKPLKRYSICVFESKTNVCAGDSGSPLLKRNREQNKFKIMGVLSRGTACQEIHKARNNETAEHKGGIFTSVKKYLDWICEQTGICYSYNKSKYLSKVNEEKIKEEHKKENSTKLASEEKQRFKAEDKNKQDKSVDDKKQNLERMEQTQKEKNKKDKEKSAFEAEKENEMEEEDKSTLNIQQKKKGRGKLLSKKQNEKPEKIVLRERKVDVKTSQESETDTKNEDTKTKKEGSAETSVFKAENENRNQKKEKKVLKLGKEDNKLKQKLKDSTNNGKKSFFKPAEDKKDDDQISHKRITEKIVVRGPDEREKPKPVAFKKNVQVMRPRMKAIIVEVPVNGKLSDKQLKDLKKKIEKKNFILNRNVTIKEHISQSDIK